MRKYILSMLILLLVFAAGSAFSQDKEIGDVYIATTDPGNAPVTGGAPWVAFAPPINVAAGATVWIGIENLYWEPNKKKLTVTLTGNDLRDLEYVNTIGYDDAGNSANIIAAPLGVPLIQQNLAVYQFQYIPQPQWEVIEFTATGDKAAVDIEGISVISSCRVPSLTQWGLMALVILLIGSSVFVIYRRRKTVTA